MTSDIEMLPLPGHNYVDGDGLWETAAGPYSAEETQAHALACVEHNVKKRDAEIERLRAEREVIGAEAVKYADKSGRLEAKVEALRAEVAAVWNAMPSGTRYLDPPDGGDVPLHEQVRRVAADAVRAERLAEALQKLAAHIRPTCSVLWDEAQAALRDHDQEGTND